MSSSRCRFYRLEISFDQMPATEKVADYPRPPRIELVKGSVAVRIGDECIATDTKYARVCETFHPPTIYIDPSAFNAGTLHPASGRPSFCEWKGIASYWDLSTSDGSDVRTRAGWSYANPSPRFDSFAGWISLYPRLVDECLLEGEPVTPQPGTFYGGWISSWTIGPFKGDPAHPELI